MFALVISLLVMGVKVPELKTCSDGVGRRSSQRHKYSAEVVILPKS
jgi:hypothetical protein